MKIDIFKKLKRIKNKKLRLKLLDRIMSFVVPFNRGMGYRITEASPKKVVVISPQKKARENHLKGAHACALALLGEYPAGLLLIQNYSPEKYRLILSELHMEYQKQGRGLLTATSKKGKNPPESITDENWIDMITQITNSEGEIVAICSTKWQLKSWDLIKTQKN